MTVFDKHRERRIIYNDDSDQQYSDYKSYGYSVTDEQSFLDCRTTPAFGTHVDTYVWCVGNGADPPWGPERTATVWPALGSQARATGIIVEACHANGLEVWGSLRMNDIHDASHACLAEANEPFKREHPEYLVAPESNRSLPVELAERNQWTVLNFAHPEVRRYRLEYIAKNAAEHDFDGYELDFTRFAYYFPLGEERGHVDEMTQLVREVRTRLDLIGERRGRPYTLVAHVMDSIEGSFDAGLDVVAWAEEGLLDALVVGMGYLPYVLPCEEWLDVGEDFGMPIYPAVNTNTYQNWWRKRFKRPTAWHEAIRAGAAYYWQEGFDGQYLFNLFCMEDRSVGPMERELVYAPLGEVGEPSAMVGKNKIYSIQPVGESGGDARFGSDPAALPIALDWKERKLPLMVGPDADDSSARFRLSVVTTGELSGRKVWVRLNHRLLAEPEQEGDLLRVDAPGEVLRTGKNELALLCDARIMETENPIIVHQVFLEAMY